MVDNGAQDTESELESMTGEKEEVNEARGVQMERQGNQKVLRVLTADSEVEKG
jgi:hypothetical protein